MNAALKRQFEAASQVDAAVETAKKTKGRDVGTVLDYDKSKGYGFVIDDDKEKIFVHQSQIIASGFRFLTEGQRISFTRGENRGKPWCENVMNEDGSPIANGGEVVEESSNLAKKRRQQLKEQWRNFFDIPQYALKGYAESLPATVANQDCFVMGHTVDQLGKVFAMAHGCCASSSTGNDCSKFVKEKLAKVLTKAYEEKAVADLAISDSFSTMESEYLDRAKNKGWTDGAQVSLALFVHALNASGQPCVQLWSGTVGACVLILCTADGTPVRVSEPHTTKKARAKLLEAGIDVSENGNAEASFAEAGSNRPSARYKLPAARLLGGRPFKTPKAGLVTAPRPDVKKIKEWRCVAGEELFLLIVSEEILSVLSDVEVMNTALDAWGSGVNDIDGWEAAAKAVVRTAQAQGPASDQITCMAVQFWWQEKPLQRLLARRADKKRTAIPAAKEKPKDDGFDMFG